MIKKSELENYAMSEILESLPQKIQEDYTSIWNEFFGLEIHLNQNWFMN